MPITEILEGLGLRCFVAPLTLLLERSSGIEAALDSQDECIESVLRQQLDQCAKLAPDEARLLLMQVCVGLPAFRYRAGAATGPEVWHPLRESLRQFHEQQGELVFWSDGDLRPAIPETLEWLRTWGC
jgi:hypothetical protein